MSKHRKNVPADWQSDATCPHNARGVECGAAWHACPRHNAASYADYMARHATDSL